MLDTYAEWREVEVTLFLSTMQNRLSKAGILTNILISPRETCGNHL